ncbi:MAG: HtaA domain-containing protein [Solirubrobacterales bacterium]
MTHASTRPVALRMIVGAAAVVAALLAFVPAANAARDPLSGGTTDLHMKKGFLKKLTNLGVGVAGVSTGQVGGNKISLPVGEGKFDPTTYQGKIISPGGFQFVKGARSVAITGVEVNTVHDTVYATIARAHMAFATISSPSTAREGFGARIKSGQLTLTEKAAKRISNQLGLKGGQRITARVMSNEFSTTVPSTLTILGQNEATLNVSSKILAKFVEKGVNASSGIKPISPAKNSKVSQFTFPITGGTLATDYGSGTIATSGGIEIVKEDKTVSPTMKITNIDVEFAQKTATVELEILPTPGATGRSSIVDLTIPSSAITSNSSARTVTIKGAEAKLQAVAASTLNSTFNQGETTPPASSEFAAGELFGTFSMVLQAQ